jgi:hypothetical protein
MIIDFKIFENKRDEQDPYGEEDWEDFNYYPVGTVVTLLPKIKDYVNSMGWHRDFLKCIGEKSRISSEVIQEYRGVMCYSTLRFPGLDVTATGCAIPRDCLMKSE